MYWLSWPAPYWLQPSRHKCPVGSSSKISKDVSLDEVVITATKVGKETPVAYSDISKQELSSRNNGQGIPFSYLPNPRLLS